MSLIREEQLLEIFRDRVIEVTSGTRILQNYESGYVISNRGATGSINISFPTSTINNLGTKFKIVIVEPYDINISVLFRYATSLRQTLSGGIWYSNVPGSWVEFEAIFPTKWDVVNIRGIWEAS